MREEIEQTEAEIGGLVQTLEVCASPGHCSAFSHNKGHLQGAQPCPKEHFRGSEFATVPRHALLHNHSAWQQCVYTTLRIALLYPPLLPSTLRRASARH